MATQSQAEIAGLNKTIIPVETMVFEGFRSNLVRAMKFPIAWTTSTDQALVVKTLFGNAPLKYPFGCLTLQSAVRSQESYKSNTLAKRGKIVMVTQDQKRFYRVHIVPMDFRFEFRVFTNDFNQVLSLNNSWQFAGELGWTKFEIQYGSTNFGIATELDSEFSFPVRDASPENVQEYVTELTGRIRGYISYAVLTEGQAADNLVVTASVGAAPGVPDEERVEFWSMSSSAAFHGLIDPGQKSMSIDHLSDNGWR